MPKKLSSYDVQTAAFKSVTADFNRAVVQGRQKYLDMATDFAVGDQSIRQHASKMNQSLLALRFLEKAAKGEYASSSSTTSYRFGGAVWEDYLNDIGALHHGFNSANNNDDEVQKRMKQNGPKKMETRLTQFLKRRVTQSVKRIGKPGALVLD